MSNRFVRASKYRHVFGRSTKKEQCYDNLRISKNAWDSNLVKANPQYLAVNIEASGGGAFAVIPVNERGKLPEQIPLFRGHTAAVLDTDWSPFNDNLIASGADDGKVFIWKVPENFTLYVDPEADEVPDVAPVSRLAGHARKVGHVLFNPSAENILASSSGDFTIKLWDVQTGESKLQLRHNDIVQSMSWNASGSLLTTTNRDKKLRVWDARQQKPAVEVAGHAGAKNSRAVWMGELDRIATTGFSRMSDRQLGLWDIRSPSEPIGGFQILDSISGVCMPFWDDGTQCLYLAGKGDGNIRYYEYVNDKFEYLSEYKSSEPQRGIAFMPKRGVNVHENEVMRCFKTVMDVYIEPVSFIVPRRAEVFQSDIYPPTVGLKPAMSAADWLGGKDGLPPKISLESIYEGNEPTEVPSDFKPTPMPMSPPAAKASSSKPTPAPAAAPAARSPPPSVNENKASMASMASKFRDQEPSSSSEDETSSFEEVPKPTERPSARAVAAAGTTSPSKRPASPTKLTSPTLSSTPRSTAAASAVRSPPPADTTPAAASSSSSAPPTASSVAAGAAAGIKDYLHDIKAMLEEQNRTMASQGQQIAQLTREVAMLKAKAGEASSGEKDERIRQLELELEEARS